MFVPHSDLSLWGLKEPGTEPTGAQAAEEAEAQDRQQHRQLKPLASNAADDEERGLAAKTHTSSDTDPWKVHVPGLDVDKPSQRSSDETRGWESSPAEAEQDPEQQSYMEQYLDELGGASWWPESETWTNPLNWLQPGDIVCFHGLQQTTALNGTCATVEGWDEATSRWSVRLASGVQKFARPENLVVVQAQAFPAAAAAAAAACFRASPGADPAAAAAPWWWSSSDGAETRHRTRAAKKGVSSRTASFASDTTTASGSARSGSFSADDVLGDHPASGAEEQSQPWTTVMMRNIPNDYTGTMLLDLLNERGFGGVYNLVYLPMDYHRKAGFGYAFIDFVSTEEAERFRDAFEGFSDWGLVSHKICNVSWSDALQGVQAHIDRYRNSPVMHDAVPDEFKPMLFENGKPVPFPAPTKSIRAPRLRKKDPRPPVQQQQQRRSLSGEVAYD